MFDFSTSYSARRAEWDEYFDFVREAKRGNLPNCAVTERHHVLPKSLFPDYASRPENIVELPYTWHVYAHALLSIATEDERMATAFHLMVYPDDEAKADIIADWKQWAELNDEHVYSVVFEQARRLNAVHRSAVAGNIEAMRIVSGM